MKASMQSHIFCMTTAGVVFALASLGLAAQDTLKSGLQPGTPEMPTLLPGSFQSWMVTGSHAGRFASPVCDYGLSPFVLVFAREIEEADKPVNTLLKKLDDLIVKHPDVRPGASMLILNDGGFRDALEAGGAEFPKKYATISVARDDLENKLKELSKSVGLKLVTLGLDTVNGPKDYQINPEAQVTVLVCYKHEVVGSYAFAKDKFTDADADKIVDVVQKIIVQAEERSRGRRR